MNVKPDGGAPKVAPVISPLNFSTQRFSCEPIPPLKGRFLPPGEYRAEWGALVARFGKGSSRRVQIVEGLRAAAKALRDAGGKWLFVDGSFVSATAVPKDWDGCVQEEGIDFAKLPPMLRDLETNRDAIKKKYRCDLFFASTMERDSGKPFRQFFQQRRDGTPKGVVVLDLGTVP